METATIKIPRLPKKGALVYEKLAAIKTELSQVNQRVKELDNAKRLIQGELDVFFQDTPQKRLAPNVILSVTVTTVKDTVITPEMVGKVLRKGYTYNTYKEVEG